MNGFRFVHAADLHLGSPVGGLDGAPPTLRERFAEASYRALENIVDLCLAERADFLVVAGDVYDTADSSLRAQVRLKEQLARLAAAGIPAYIAHGNHDHCGGVRADLDWPPGVHFFPPGDVAGYTVRREGRELARVLGISYPRAAVHENYAKRLRHDGPLYGVAVLHANVGADPSHGNYAPCRVEDLVDTGCHYIALGHIHAGRIVHRERPWAIYPGNPQGRNPKETGPHGCYLVEVDGSGWASPRFVATDVVRWEHVELAIDGLASEQELIDRLGLALADLLAQAEGRDVIARVTLTGRGPLHNRLRRKGVVDDLLEEMRRSLGEDAEGGRFPVCWVESIRCRTQPDLDEARLLQSDSLVGDFLRLFEDPSLHPSLEEALAPLFQHARARRYLAMPQGDELAELLAQARQLGIDLLVGEEGE